jgi:SAM-dependent methyltransferase
MAHRDPEATVTAVDHAGSIAAARSTAEAIGISGRVRSIEADPLEAELPSDTFDITLVSQRINGLNNTDAAALIRLAVAATRPGGRVVVIDLFRGVGSAEGVARPGVLESIEALRLNLKTTDGRIATLQEAQQRLLAGGLEQVQFAYLPASRLNLGIVVGVKPAAGAS